MVKPVDSTTVGCKVSSLVRSNTVWNSMVLAKVFCEFMGGGCGSKGKSISRTNIYSSDRFGRISPSPRFQLHRELGVFSANMTDI